MLALGTATAPVQNAKAQSGSDFSLPEGTRIVLQLNDHLSTRLNAEGDAFTANVIVPVYQGDHLLIPKGSVVTGSISRVLRPGRIKGKAVMNLLFQGIRIPGRGELQIVASLARVDQDGNGGVQSENTVKGEGSAGRDAGKILTPSLAGAGIGGLAGGGRGAAIGGGVGAVVGLATVFTTRGKDLEMRRGSTLDIVLDRPLFLPVEAESHSTRVR
jgi:type IV secretion system protein VirB10